MKQRIFNRMLSLLLAAVLVMGTIPTALAAGETAGLTRARARDMLLTAADDYHPGLTAGDILRGYPDGGLREDETVTRAEVLVMLSRAFGELPAPVGDSARWAVPAQFTDVPEWAGEELADLFAAGIVTDDGDGLLSPGELVTEEELTLIIRRVYALLGANLKDDFYATVNKEWLDSSVIYPGYATNGTLYEIAYNTDQQVAQLIRDIAAGEHKEGSAEDKIKTLYENILNWEARDAAGIEPIRPYLEAIDGASTLDELMELHMRISSETTASLLLGYGITQDLADTDQKVLYFATMSASLPQEYYANEAARSLFTQYIATLFTLAGVEEEAALVDAAAYVDLEAALAEASMSQEEKADINNTYHVYQADELQAMFPHVDLDALREGQGLPARDTCVVSDPGLLAAAAALFTQEHLDVLRLAMKAGMLGSFGGMLSREFQDASRAFNAALLGTAGETSDEESAAAAVQSYLSDYLGQVYVEEYFSPEAKAGVEDMIDDILEVYADRIGELDWMSETTKAKAIEKVEAITVNVGYPDEWDDLYDDVDLRSVEEGGSYMENVVAMSKAAIAEQVSEFDQPVDKTQWSMAAYTVNAYYDATANSINFPAGILQAPLYDVEADYTENLGGIGYIIAHEITHAFDNNGAQFDLEGDQNNWWTEEDYAAFQALCGQVVAFYDGVEAIPGVTCNGALTLSENVADLGALACITQIEGQEARPDYQTLYESVARTWRGTASRETRAYYAAMDVHAPDKLRGSRVLQSLDEFFEAFDIQPGDGMYVAPEDRARIW